MDLCIYDPDVSIILIERMTDRHAILIGYGISSHLGLVRFGDNPHVLDGIEPV
jgi:hypothetical protein